MARIPLRRAATALGASLLLAAFVLPAGLASAQAPNVIQAPADLALEVLSTETQDPSAIDVAPDGRVIWAERKGTVKVIVPGGTAVTAGRVPVAANECADCPDNLNEGGLHGLLLDRDFANTGIVYLYYAVPGTVGVAPNPPKHPEAGGTQAQEGLFRLSRFVLSDGNVLDLASEEVVFENAVEWFQCCHYGGDLDWMPDGTIVLSVGDDTNPFESNGYSPIDERPDREAFNAQRTSGNPADRRGKVLRLNPDGTVPADNPHVGDAAYDPYVYAMGFRSDYRIAVDEATGTVYVGNVGPDARNPDPRRGPMGYDEIEVIPPGGGTDHGWPFCIGPNVAYNDYDFATGTSGAAFSCAGKVPAAFHYSYTPESNLLYPQLGSQGGRTAMAGLVYRAPEGAPLALPDRLQDKFLFSEWSRNLIVSIPVKADGTLDTTPLAQLREGVTTRHAHDMAIGPDGAVYLIEYGTGFWNNTNSRVSRIVPADAAPNPVAAAAPATSFGISRIPVLVAGAVLLLLGALRHRKAVV
jgi:glucose/arabinose dehydrogenase